jgi:hypothetical protein
VVIHLRVVSPPDVTTTLVPMLDTESAVMNLTVLPAAVRNPDGDAVHFDVPQGDLPAQLVRAAGHRGAHRGHRDPHQLPDPDCRRDLLNVTVLAVVAIAGLPVQRALWQRVTRRASARPPD